MSDIIIRDPVTHDGARVDSSGRVKMTAVSTSEAADVSRNDELAYGIQLPEAELTDTANYRLIGYMKNDNTSLDFVLNQIHLDWNGGNTNHNRICRMQVYIGTTAPSANNTAVTPGNMNTNSTLAALLTVFGWDGVGTEITVASKGLPVIRYFPAQGINYIDTKNILRLAPGLTMGIACKCEEAGSLSMGYTGFFQARTG